MVKKIARLKRLIRKADDKQLQNLIRECANDLEERIANCESNYDGDEDPWEDDSFYDMIADATMETDSYFIIKAVEILKPGVDSSEIQDDALDYVTDRMQNVDDDYVKRYEILLTGVKQALDK